jgi:serine protease AprX
MTSLVARRPGPLHADFRIRLAAAATTLAALAALLIVISLGASPPPSPMPTAAASTAPPSLSPDLAKLAAAHPLQRVEVIIQLARGTAAAEGPALVRSFGGVPGLDLHIIHGLSARLTAGAARRLAASPLVHTVSLNAPVKESMLVNFNTSSMATTFDRSVRATKMWNYSTGKGVGVAVIDTGITGDPPDFRTSQTNTTSRVVASAVVDTNATTAADTYGHGTDVAGLIAGNGGYRDPTDPLWGKYAGSAPDASLVSIKIGDDSGQASTLDAIYGLQFAVDHKADYNIRVVNLSFRSTSAQSAQTDPLDAAAEQAWFSGIVVVVAAGNLGSASDAVSYAPANDPYVITVGAVDEQGTASNTDDVQTSWSSRGVTQDGVAKPDLLAPGAHIVSTLAPGSAFGSFCPSCVIGGAYFQASGTSMAAPIVSGAVADLLAVYPNWSPDRVKGAIMGTSTSVSGGRELNTIGAYWEGFDQQAANQGLTPNSLIDPTTGTIDYTAASWSAGSWSSALSPLAASWSAASWSCSDCSSSTTGSVSPTAGSWSTLGWATYWG